MTQLPAPPAETMLRVVRVLAPLAATVMTVTVVVGLASAPEGAAAALFDNVWGRATVIDLYLALLALWVWIIWRERRAGAAVLWGLLLLATGSIAAWVYIAWRANQSRDVQELLVGPNDISLSG